LEARVDAVHLLLAESGELVAELLELGAPARARREEVLLRREERLEVLRELLEAADLLAELVLRLEGVVHVLLLLLELEIRAVLLLECGFELGEEGRRLDRAL